MPSARYGYVGIVDVCAQQGGFQRIAPTVWGARNPQNIRCGSLWRCQHKKRHNHPAPDARPQRPSAPNSWFSEWKRVDQGGGKLTYTQKNPKLEKGQRKEIKTQVSDKNTFKNHIFRYKSWQDETNFIINNNNDNFLDIKFVYEIKFDSSAEESIKKFKKEITDKEKSEGNRTEFEDIFDVPNFKENAFCVREKNYNKELIYLILGIIINLLGFSSFVNLFAKKEIDKIEIKILKSFSSSEQYKNKYDEHLKEYDNIKLKDDKNKFGYLLEPLIIKNPID